MSLSASRALSVPVPDAYRVVPFGARDRPGVFAEQHPHLGLLGAGMPTVWRYIVIRVDASLETLVSAEENCSHATTMVNPSSAPYTRPTQVKNGDNAPLCPSLTGFCRVRSASHILAAATNIAATRAKARSNQRPAIPKSPMALLTCRASRLRRATDLPSEFGRGLRPSIVWPVVGKMGWTLRVGVWAFRSSCGPSPIHATAVAVMAFGLETRSRAGAGTFRSDRLRAATGHDRPTSGPSR